MIGHNYGVIGGYVTTLEEQTIVAANRIADILKGAEVNDFPKITETAKSISSTIKFSTSGISAPVNFLPEVRS